MDNANQEQNQVPQGRAIQLQNDKNEIIWQLWLSNKFFDTEGFFDVSNEKGRDLAKKLANLINEIPFQTGFAIEKAS